ncbi:MAG: hypothetical protein ACPGJS_19015 [Flammeovirgaceae bacterium]
MPFKRLATCLFFLAWVLPIHAQEVFTAQDQTFFQQQVEPIKNYLRLLNLWGGEQVKDVQIEVRKDKTGTAYVILFLEPASITTWRILHKDYEKKYNQQLEEVIFEKFIFLCEISAKQALLVVSKSTNYGLYQLKAGVDPDKNYNFSIEDQFIKTKAWVFEEFDLPKSIVYPSTEGNYRKDKKAMRNHIITVLKNYYKDKGSWITSSKIDVLDSYDTKVYLKVSNLKKELIHDSIRFFELIFIKVSFEENGADNIAFKVQVNAKYGTSILLAPRDSAFKDIARKSSYQNYIDAYALKVRTFLYNKLDKS